MVKKRTVVVIGLFATIVFTSILLRADFFSTVHAPSAVESEFTQMPVGETVVTPAPEPIYAEPKPIEIAPAEPDPKKTCYVTGCSGQLCTTEEGMMSTCEYKEEYACYQTATCEVQPSGECGWTETDELRSCRANSGTAMDGSVELAI